MLFLFEDHRVKFYLNEDDSQAKKKQNVVFALFCSGSNKLFPGKTSAAQSILSVSQNRAKASSDTRRMLFLFEDHRVKFYLNEDDSQAKKKQNVVFALFCSGSNKLFPGKTAKGRSILSV